MASKKTLEHYLRQMRLIEEHREKWAEQNIRRHYKDLMKDLQEFLGVEYANLAQDDKLTYEILHGKGQHARFIEEVERRINKFSPKAAQEIRDTVQLTYKKCFEGMVDAVTNSDTPEQLKLNLKGLRAVAPDVIKNVVSNSFMEKALEKNHKSTIYDIKQQIGIGLSQGDRMSTMARRISEQLGKNYNRSVMIARTECHRVREAGFQDSSARVYQKLKDSDSDYVMVKIWKTMQDLAVRPYRMKGKKGHKNFVKGKGPDHTKMHGVMVLVDEKFDLGDGVTAIAPGQSGVAGHDINCRCYLSRDLMTKEKYEKLSGKKLTVDNPAKPYELKEEVLLDNKETLEDEKDKLLLEKANLEAKQYDGIWKESVTVKDYDAKKDKIKLKRNYYEKSIKSSTFNRDHYPDYAVKWQGEIDKNKKFLKLLDEFETNGKAYLKITNKIEDIDKDLLNNVDQLKAVRQKIMKLKGIDVDKMQEEIDDLVSEINKLASANKKLTLKSKVGEFTDGQVETAFSKILPNHSYNLDLYNDESVKDVIEFFLSKDQQAAFKKELKKLVKNNPDDVAKLEKLRQKLTDKSNKLEKIRKRYGLEDNAFSQARKDAAYWFTDKNGSAEAADKVLREKCGEIWRKATKLQKESAYRYTHTYSCYNEPLRGYEYGTSKFLGVGNVDMDTIGMSYRGYKRGEIKKWIDDLTNLIDKCSYDHDMWFQRGSRLNGMDKFFNIKPSDFKLSEKELAKKLMGTTPTEYAFMSMGTAKGRGLNTEFEGITLNIFAPKGTKMYYLEPFSHYGGGTQSANWDGKSKQRYIGSEAEMLLQRNTQFKVIKVEKSGNRWFIDLEVISQKR